MSRSLERILRCWGAPRGPGGADALCESAEGVDALYESAVGLLLRLVLVAIARRAGVLEARTSDVEEAPRAARDEANVGVVRDTRVASSARPYLAWSHLEACCQRLAEQAAISCEPSDPRAAPGWLVDGRAFPLLSRASARLPDLTMAALSVAVEAWLGSNGSSPEAGEAGGHCAPRPSRPRIHARRRRQAGAQDVAVLAPTARLPTAADVAALGHVYEAACQYRVARSSDGRLRLARGTGRRSAGVHYTPADLAARVVRSTLAPLLVAGEPATRTAGSAPSGTLGSSRGGRPSGGEPSPQRDLRVADLAMGSGVFLAEAVCLLAEDLRGRSRARGGALSELQARRRVVERCAFGVDLDPLAVELGRWSLWLLAARPEARALGTRPKAKRRDHWPMAVLGSHLVVGDALVGLAPSDASVLEDARPTASEGSPRERPRGPADTTQGGTRPDAALLAADLAVAARLTGSRRTLSALLRDSFERVHRARDAQAQAELRTEASRLLGGRRCVHWPLHFRDVLRSGGFDAIVGNPPFLGGKRISEVLGGAYNRWLGRTHDGTSRNTDLVAHFFRRGFDLLRPGGCLGLIATNTIAQGDTCEAGLAWIVAHGGTIYEAEPELTWPGDAAVVVSLVHLCRGPWGGPRSLGGKTARTIGPRLQPAEPTERPVRLEANRRRAFVGCYVLGMGFTFDDEHRKEEAWPVSLMHRLVADDPRNASRIAPYIGGEEVGESPTHEPRRYVIDFGELGEREARTWPALYALLEQRVKPFRLQKDARRYPRMVHEWWKFWNGRPQLREAVAELPRVLVTPRVARHSVFTFLPPGIVCSEQLIVFALDRFAAFGLLQSSVHEVWARCYSSTLGRGLRYTPSSCFETFPFPDGWDGAGGAALERIGATYYLARSAAMRARGEGLSKLYGRMHDPRCRDATIVELRSLHARLDRAVCEAYGWQDTELAYHWDAPRRRAGSTPRPRGGADAPAPTGLVARARADVLARLAARNAELARRSLPPTRGR